MIVLRITLLVPAIQSQDSPKPEKGPEEKLQGLKASKCSPDVVKCSGGEASVHAAWAFLKSSYVASTPVLCLLFP